MLGIILTLFAVIFVICFAFYRSDRPSEGTGPDALFYVAPRNSKKRTRQS